MAKKWLGIFLSVITSVFGVWQAPVWLRRVIGLLTNSASYVSGKIGFLYNNKKGMFYGILLSVLLLSSGIGGGYYWWLNRPQPVRLSVSIENIQATALIKEGEAQTLKIQFGGSAARMESIGKEVNSGIVMSPAQDGVWTWTRDDLLEFKIVGDWPVGETIEVQLDKTLFPDHVHLKRYKTTFSTEKFSATVKKIEFYQNPKNSKEKRVVTTIQFSHPVEPKSFEKRLSYVLESRPSDEGRKGYLVKKKFTVTYDDFFGEAYVHSELLSIPVDDSWMQIKIEKGMKSSRGGEATEDEVADLVEVPSMFSYFKVDDVQLTLVRNSDYEPEQVLVVSTTDRVDEVEIRKHLKVYRLPQDKETVKKGKKIIRKKYRWSLREVTKELIEKSELVELKPIPQPKDFNSMTSYKYNSEPGRTLYIMVKKGLGSFGGYKLANNAPFVKRVEKFPKELSIMSSGSLLSLSGDQKVSVVGRDLDQIRFAVHRVLPGQLANLLTQTGGSFSQPTFSNYNFDEENLSEPIYKVHTMPFVARGKSQYTHFDFSQVVRSSGIVPRGLFLFKAESWNRKRKYTENPSDRRLIMLTDLGIISKKDVQNGYDVFIQSIASGDPVSGVRVSVLGKNGLEVISLITDERGHVKFGSLDSFVREKTPIAFVAKKGVDLSFLPLTDHINLVNYSKFDVGGVYSRSKSASLQSYLFSDRGIYRPGDEARFGFVVKDTDWAKSLKQTRVEVQVRNPKGNIVVKQRMKLTDVGLQEYSFKTMEEWPTGSYSVSLYLVKKKDQLRRLDTISVKVEEFLPDRMKITARFSRVPKKGWLKPDDLEASASLQNLFGTPAQNRRMRAEISLTPSYPAFRSYKEYQFFDPLRSKRRYKEELAELTSDDKGLATFDLHLEKYDSASYHLSFMVEGFEAESGRSVVAAASTLVSPLDYLIGYKSEEAISYLSKNSETKVKLIAIDPDLKMFEVKGLKLRRVQFRPISTLIKQSNGTYKYESVEKEVKISDRDLNISNKGYQLSLNTENPGDYAYVIIGSNGMELNRVRYSVMGEGNLAFDLEKNAELQVKLNRADYNPGDTVEVNIRSPYTGFGLITIERDQIYAFKWFKTTSNSSVQSIRIPKHLEGNGYINVTFTRSLHSKEIFMSPLSVGVAPFSINRSSRVNTITLKTPDLIRPGKSVQVQYSSKHQGKAILFAVDQGILSVAKYKKPDPLSHFYKKRALEVQTRQILDLLLPEFHVVEERRSSSAGGSGALIGKNLNPFKRKRDEPVAIWSGVVATGPTVRKWKVSIPDYFSGQVRFIAVAIGSKSMDSISKSSVVKGHFVISPNTPMAMAPGDKATVTAGISNNVAESGEDAPVVVSISVPKGLKVIGDLNKSLSISANSEASVTYEVEALEYLGNVDINWKASWKDKVTRLKSTLSLRPLSIYRSEVSTGVVKSASDKKVITSRRTYKKHATHSVKVSKIPISIAFGLNRYLEGFPHGCTEQIVSKAFPAMLMSSHEEFDVSKKKVLKNISELVSVLRSRELPSGGLSIWPGRGDAGHFHTAYAAHFLTESRERGLLAGGTFLKDSLLPELREFAEKRPDSLEMARSQAFSAYLLTRNEELATKALVGLEEWLAGYKDENWVSDITLIYMAASYKLMKADQKADQLIKKYQLAPKAKQDYKYGVYDDNIKKLMTLFIVSKHFTNYKDLFSSEQIVELVNSLGNSFNTRSSAMAMLAFLAYSEANPKAAVLDKVKLYEISESGKEKKLAVSKEMFSSSDLSGDSAELKIDNAAKGPLFYSVEQSGFSLKNQDKRSEKSIEVYREFFDLEGKPVKSVKVGSEIEVRIKVRSTDQSWYFNLAVVDLLPGGFEPVLDSIDRSWSGAHYVDVREDRLVLFMDSSDSVATYKYRLKATNQGVFQVPAIFSKSMYDRSVYSIGEVGVIEVVK